MDRRKSELIQYVLIVVLAFAIVGILFYMIPYRYKMNTVETYDVDYNVVDNPLMGLAPSAEDIEQCENNRLVYIELRWSEWEPQKGVYNIAALESRCNIEKWKAENKHAVLRFICDKPGETDHIDIPKWLYNLTADGEKYNNEYGKGYSPNYTNETFMKYHENAIKALAEYCNSDSFVAFVQLGSIGHWGEWHATGNNGKNIMPDGSVCIEYANQYANYFKNVVFLTRRNYDFAVENNMGFYNDMTGDENDTAEWLQWISDGGIQKTLGDDLIIKSTSMLGRKSPIGGEFTSAVAREQLLGENYGDVLSLVSSTNMTFIGPNTLNLEGKDNAVAKKSLLKRMGYRIYISRLETQYDFGENLINVKLNWKNDGNAGFFFDWPVTVNIYNSEKQLIYWQGLELDLRDLNDQEEIITDLVIPYNDEIREEYYIGIVINDKEKKDYIRLAMIMSEDLGYIDESQIIYHYLRK